MITDAGDLDPQALVALAFDKVVIKTTATPDIEIDLRQAGTGKISAAVRTFQPTVILSGRAGRVVIAPGGEVIDQPGPSMATIVGGGLVLGIAAFLGAKFFL
jgi:hypothetical protein